VLTRAGVLPIGYSEHSHRRVLTVLRNICAAFATLAVFHLEISASLPPVNIFWLLKSWPMLVTRDVSQAAMGPYVAEAVAAFVIHAVTAVRKLASVIPS
jgi:hypothetical protein